MIEPPYSETDAARPLGIKPRARSERMAGR